MVFFSISEVTIRRKKDIYRAMKLWSDKTCIRFKPRTNEKDYIEFFAKYGQ